MNMEIEKIIVGERRKANPDKVRELAASIGEIGLLNPVIVYREGDKTAPSAKVHLVAGRHRLEAAKSLGMTTIAVEVILQDRAELAEIDENLMRSDLTEMERARCVKRRLEILAARARELATETIGNVGRPVSTGRDKAAKETGALIGKHYNQVKTIAARAEKIAEDVQNAIPADTSGVELDALASLEPDEQRQAVERVKSGVDKSFREARDFIRGEDAGAEKTRKSLAELRRAWAKATPEARSQFREEIA